jgi:NADPH2:quinone reductase
MKAAWYSKFGEAADVLEVGDLPDPEPGAGEVRVRLSASGINPSDVKSRAGLVRPLAAERVVPHSDGAGVIDRVGPGVDRAHVGRRVWTFNAAYRRALGTAAQFVCLPLELTATLPAALDFRRGACLGVPAMTAHRCLFNDHGDDRGPLQGRTVLVTGGGGVVGNLAVQMARWAGAQVIATAGSAATLAHARAAGAHEVVDYRDAEAYRQIAQLTQGRGVDRIVEVDLAANAARSLDVLAPSAVIGCYASPSDREPRIPFYAWAARRVTLSCVLVYEMSTAQRERIVADIEAWAQSEFCRIAVAEALPLAEIVRAHQRVERGGKIGQVVLDID